MAWKFSPDLREPNWTERVSRKSCDWQLDHGPKEIRRGVTPRRRARPGFNGAASLSNSGATLTG